MFEGCGHFPHRTEPERFTAVLRRFLAETEPVEFERNHWRDLLCAGRPDRVDTASTGELPSDHTMVAG